MAAPTRVSAAAARNPARAKRRSAASTAATAGCWPPRRWRRSGHARTAPTSCAAWKLSPVRRSPRCARRRRRRSNESVGSEAGSRRLIFASDYRGHLFPLQLGEQFFRFSASQVFFQAERQPIQRFLRGLGTEPVLDAHELGDIGPRRQNKAFYLHAKAAWRLLSAKQSFQVGQFHDHREPVADCEARTGGLRFRLPVRRHEPDEEEAEVEGQGPESA